MEEEQSAVDLSRSRNGNKRVHVALPIRVTYWEQGVRTALEMACTYDIHPQGARVTGLHNVRRVGDLITVERGRNKALFRVRWIGDPDSELRGQFGIECIEEEKLPWANELQEAEEVYDSIVSKRRRSTLSTRRGSEENRRSPRFLTEGMADLLKWRHSSPVSARLKDISEQGCQVVLPALIMPGNQVELNLSVSHCQVTVHGKIRHAAKNLVSGIEFHRIRRGDHPLLQCLLRKLQQDSRDGAWNLKVVEV